MASEEGQPVLQVPRHEFRVVDDGTKETVEITVQLPGVLSASEISVRIEPPQTVTVSVPNRYQLQLRLAMPIAQRAELVRFRTKTARLNMTCRVLTPDEIAEQEAAAAAAAEAGGAEVEPATAASNNSGSNSSATPQLVTSSSNISREGSTAAAAAVAAAGGSNAGSSSGGRQQQQDPSAVLESFLPPPTKAERKKMQQEEQRRKEAEEKRRREEEAAAAAEAERQRQAEAAAVARRAAEEKRREEAQRKAAAKAAAAEEAQRREQQRRLNKAAAEEWLSRGHAAIAEENIETASKALNKAKELDPNNKDGIQKLTKELSALRQKAAAAAAGRRGSSPAHGSSGNNAAGGSSAQEPPRAQDGSNGQHQQQQQQWSYWQRRQQARHGVKDEGVRDILDKWSSGGHARNIVGWWCGFVDFLCYWITWFAAVSVEWAGGIPSSTVRGGRAGRAFLWCVNTAGNILMFVPPLSMVAWQLAWQKPLSVVAYVRRVGGDSHLEAAEWMLDWQFWLSEREDIPSALTKVVLASGTGGTVYAAVWGTCCLSLGPHSLLGWLWALVGWVWRILLWDPSYALQVVAAGVGTGFCSVQRPGPCWLTLYPLQVLLSNRGWGTLLTVGGSFLYSNLVKDWRPSWRQYRAPWWQAVLVTVVPVLVTRSISRAGLWWLFFWPVSLLGRLGWSVVKAAGYPVGVVVKVAGSALQAPTDLVSSVLSTPAGQWTSKVLHYAALPVTYPVGGAFKLAAATSRVVLPGWVLKQAAGVLCSWNQSFFGSLCQGFTAAATAKLAQSNLQAAFPHAWWWDVGLFMWLFYVMAVITAWEEEFGKDYYKQQQQEQQQRRQQQQQQQRPRRAPGSDDEAEHNSLGDKQSDFPMGFGAVSVPAGCEVVSVQAVLEAKDYYMVMGYSSREEVNPESLKTKRRQLVLAVHPDKVGHDYPGANLAAGRVNKAYETLSDPAMRSAYDSILANHTRGRAGRAAAAAGAAGGGSSSSAWVEEYSDELYERPPAEDKFMCQDMGCPGCGGFHTTYILPKAPFGVRWCAECRDWHPVGKGEVWAHWTPGPMGMSWLGGARLLLCADPDGPTYDVTEVFRCKEAGGILPKHKAMCNTHINPFLAATRGFGSGGGGRGGGGSSTARRSRKKGRRNR